MRRDIPERRSRAAGWARLSGALALPVLALTALGARSGFVPAEAVLPLIGLAFLLALAALGLAGIALVDIWESGAGGAGRAIAGLAYALPVLALLAAVAVAAILYPRRNDVSTDPADPPPLASVAAAARPAAAAPAADAEVPAVRPRLYEQTAAEVYAAVRQVAAARGWALAREVPPDSYEPAANAAGEPAAADAVPVAGKGTVTQSRSEATASAAAAATAAASPPQAAESGLLHAVARTPLFRFADDVVVRVETLPEGTRVDVRSASRTGFHDLGQNARRISSFMAELDSILQQPPEVPEAQAASE